LKGCHTSAGHDFASPGFEQTDEDLADLRVVHDSLFGNVQRGETANAGFNFEHFISSQVP
jgi:hypothetical protein